MRFLLRKLLVVVSVLVCFGGAGSVNSQAQNRLQLPSMTQPPTAVAPPQTNLPTTILPNSPQSGFGQPQFNAPQFGPPQLGAPQNSAGATPWVPVQSGSGTSNPFGPPPPGATLGQQIQPFDPYSSSNAIGPRAGQIIAQPPSFGTPSFGAPTARPSYPPPGQTYAPPAGTTYVPPNIVGPNPGLQSGNWQPVLPPAATIPRIAPPVPNLNPFQQPSFGNTLPPPLNSSGATFPSIRPPIAPAPLFPQGLPWSRGQETLFQDTGALYTYLYGDDGDDLAMHDVELFTSAVFKNFAFSPNGLRVTPGFVFHFLDGPAVPDRIILPSQLYSAYIDTHWQPQITPQFSADLNVRVGVFSDFNEFNGDTLRFPSRALGVLQVTPTTAIKLGVEYFDRIDAKLFPAGGIVWTPNDQTYFDIYFPRPKLAQYLTTYGNTEMWWYIGGEYGGGSWTLERDATAAVDPLGRERIDINDIRVFLGIDWNNLDRFNGLLEIGYVFEREIVVQNHPDESIKPGDTFMVRGGLRF